MKSIKNLFIRKLSWEQHSFTDIVASGEQLMIFCPEDSFKTYILLSYILSWKDHFKKIVIVLTDYNYTFFKEIDQDEITKYFNINNIIKPYNNSVIFNFNYNKITHKILDLCKNSTIMDINNQANLQFIPTPKDPIALLRKFADFFDFSWKSSQFKIAISKSELALVHDRFIRNRFKNFILDFSNSISTKKIEEIVQTIKHEFSANIYFTGKRIHDKDFINIEEIQAESLLGLYKLAKVSDLFITDKIEVAGVFADLNVNQIFIGSKLSNSSLICVEQKNIFEMKNIIQDILNK